MIGLIAALPILIAALPVALAGIWLLVSTPVGLLIIPFIIIQHLKLKREGKI